MPYRKFSTLVGVAVCSAMLVVTDASAQPSQRDGRRYGGNAIGHTAPCVVAPRTVGPRTRGFYAGRINTEPVAPRIVNDPGFGYPYQYGHYAYPDDTYSTTDTAATTTASLRQAVDTNVPYGWIHASVPYGHGTTVPDRYYSHGGVCTDTSNGAWTTATTTSDR